MGGNEIRKRSVSDTGHHESQGQETLYRRRFSERLWQNEFGDDAAHFAGLQNRVRR